MVCLADGSDLGGSLRNPASFCNVMGLRPSPGRVPSWPVTDPADVLGVQGPMARTVADAALLLAVQSGPDPRAALVLDAPPPALATPAGFPAVISCYRMASPRQEGSMEKLRDNAVRAAGLGR